MGAAKLLWALALLSLAAPAISDPHYLVVFPAVIHHPSVEKFCVLLRSLPETVHLTVTLEMKIQNHTLLDKDVDNPGSYECTSFQVPAFVAEKRMSPYLLAEEEIANVHVLIRNGDSVSFNGRKKVLVKRSYTKNLMVLDKPFYKPEETVKFRIVRLDEEFKALGETIPFVELKDPNGNRIGQWVDVEPRHGIVDLSFPLASEAALGTYTLKMGEGWDNQREFSVEEYVIPTFEVFFKFPPLVTHLDEDIQIHVLGRYTYGKPVRGNVRLRLTRGMSFYFFERRVHQETLANIELDYTGQTDKAGCASFTIKAEDIHLSQKGYQNLVQLSAELEEEGTGVTISGSDTIAVATRAITAEFINLNPFYKRGVPYTGKMKFTVRQVPYKNQTVFLTVDLNNVETHLPYVTDENGEVHFSLDTTKWEDTLIALRGRHHIFNVTQGDISDLEAVRYEAFSWLKPFYSESNSFLEIQHVEEELPCEKDQEVRVDYILDRKELGPDADFVDFYYVVVSKGKIVSSGQKQVPVGQDETLKGTFSLTLSTSSDLAPTAKLLVYAVFADGEVAADVDVFTIDKCFKHKVTLGFSQVEELPGSKVNLQIEAAPGALCSLRAVDKSVVLKENDTLTPEKVYRVPYYHSDRLIGARGFDYPLEDFEPYPCLPSEHRRQNQFMIAPWFQSQADVYGLLKELGMKVLTNTKVKKPVSCELPIAERRLLKSTPVLNDLSGIHLPMAVAVVESGPQTLDSGTTVEEKAKPRTYFPETWVWNLVPVNEEGKATHSVTVPDTITDWNANAFCVADIGFGLSQPATLRVFKPFFVELVLPYSVVRGETLQLKATVFNYLKDCIQVRVHLLESRDVEVKPCPECHFTTCLCADEAKTFSWNVTATQLGQVNLSVATEAEETQELCGNQISVALARGRSDTVVKALLVKPEGVLEEETHNVFLCSSGDAVLDAFSLELPGDVVSGSGRATISTIGDIMGAALQNVDQLLQMPFGCGEQNIAKFVPNIFILQYLEKTNQVTAENKEKGTEYMKSGYQRQLLYKRDDGSYSAFGKRDSEGNTWLTAFVAKAFGQAKPYVYIDEKHVQDALQWLSQHQRPSGCFESVGRLFNNALKGGVEDDLSLTAYVTASLLEAHVEKNHSMVQDALLCLKKNLTSVSDAYSKAMLAYVFTLAGETPQQLLKDLDELAIKTEGAITFSETETSAYVLLAYLSTSEVSTDDITYASQIVRALTREQNSYGGFSSTQDTVVSLQALAKYASLTYREIDGVKVLVKSIGGFQHEFHVGKKNRLVLQQASLPEVPGLYKVEVLGNGCVYVQTTLRHNYLPKKNNIFALSVETSPKECNQTSRKKFDIHLQVSYTGKRKTSNMALIEVDMVSGYVAVQKSLRRLEENPHVKKLEGKFLKITIYLDQLDNTVQNYSFSVKQSFEVTDLKPATVKVYDYYHPEDNTVVEYNAPCSQETTKEDSL